MSAEQSSLLKDEMLALGQRAREAARVLREAPTGTKNKALHAAADAIRAHAAAILAANAKDMNEAASARLTPALLDRLLLDDKRIAAMAKGI